MLHGQPTVQHLGYATFTAHTATFSVCYNDSLQCNIYCMLHGQPTVQHLLYATWTAYSVTFIVCYMNSQQCKI